MIAPAPRLLRESLAPHEIVAEVAALLATAYIRLRFPATARVREMEASPPVEREESRRQSLSPPPISPSCNGPAESPPARRST
jgi:hypothetical protein